MGFIALLACISIVAALSAPVVILVRRDRRRRLFLEAVNQAGALKEERFRLEGEAYGLLDTLEHELPEAYRSPNTGLSPTDPDSLILTEKARQALQRRGEIIKRITCIDREINRLLGGALTPDEFQP